MSAFVVRRARPEHAPELAALNGYAQRLHHEAAPTDFGPVDPVATQQWFGERLGEEDVLTWCADAGARSVGYLFAQEVHRPPNPFTIEQRVLSVHHVAVAPEFRHLGIASALFAAAEEAARSRGLRGLRLDSWSFNHDAHGFFRRRGFAPFAVRFARDL